MLEVQLLMQVLLEEKLLSIHMVVGAHMEEVLSQEKMPQRLIDLLHTMLDMLLSQSLLTDLHTEF